MLSCFSRVLFFVTLWTVALQAPPSMGFSKQEYWNGLAFFPPRDLLDPGMEPTSPMSRIQGSRTVMGWFLPRWGRHSVTEYPEDSYWEGARLKPWLVKKLQSFKRARVGGCFHPFFGSDNIPVLSVFRHNYKGRAGWGGSGWLDCVLNHHWGSSEWPRVMLTFCEIIYVQEKNTKASLWIPDQFCSSLAMRHGLTIKRTRGHRKGREGAKDKCSFLTLAASAEVALWGVTWCS